MAYIWRILSFLLIIISLSALQASAGPAPVCRNYKTQIKVVKHLVKHDGWLCMTYLSWYRTRSPIPTLSRSTLENTCYCILQQYQISQPVRRRLRHLPKPVKRTCNKALARAITGDFSQPEAVCKYHMAITREESILKGMTAAKMSQGCQCILNPAPTTTRSSSLSQKTASPKAPATTSIVAFQDDKSSSVANLLTYTSAYLPYTTVPSQLKASSLSSSRVTTTHTRSLSLTRTSLVTVTSRHTEPPQNTYKQQKTTDLITTNQPTWTASNIGSVTTNILFMDTSSATWYASITGLSTTADITPTDLSILTTTDGLVPDMSTTQSLFLTWSTYTSSIELTTTIVTSRLNPSMLSTLVTSSSSSDSSSSSSLFSTTTSSDYVTDPLTTTTSTADAFTSTLITTTTTTTTMTMVTSSDSQTSSLSLSSSLSTSDVLTTIATSTTTTTTTSTTTALLTTTSESPTPTMTVMITTSSTTTTSTTAISNPSTTLTMTPPITTATTTDATTTTIANPVTTTTTTTTPPSPTTTITTTTVATTTTAAVVSGPTCAGGYTSPYTEGSYTYDLKCNWHLVIQSSINGALTVANFPLCLDQCNSFSNCVAALFFPTRQVNNCYVVSNLYSQYGTSDGQISAFRR